MIPATALVAADVAAATNAGGYPARMHDRLARAVSILGHPLLVLPAALALPTVLRDGDPQALRSIVTCFAVFAALMLAWSWWQVKRGRWAHVDASRPSERSTLNRTLLVAIALGALLAWLRSPTPDLAIMLTLAACIVAAAMLASRWCKLSLHVAMAVYAAGLLWPLGAWAVGAGCAFAALVAWSRLQLSRHQPRDIVAGAAAGALAAVAVWLMRHLLRATP
jgi:protein-S-isoprenylcysteine O-methyltransferase Ste14